MINNEDEAFTYILEPDSCHSAGFSAHINVEPMTGIIPPRSRYIFQFSYNELCCIFDMWIKFSCIFFQLWLKEYVI